MVALLFVFVATNCNFHNTRCMKRQSYVYTLCMYKVVCLVPSTYAQQVLRVKVARGERRNDKGD